MKFKWLWFLNVATMLTGVSICGCSEKYSCTVTNAEKSGGFITYTTKKIDVESCEECQNPDKTCTEAALSKAGYNPEEWRDCKQAKTYENCISCQGDSHTFDHSDPCE